MIPGLYTYAATAIVAGALAFGGGWQVQAWRWDAADKQRIEQEAKERQKQLDRAHVASTTFEDKRTTNETRYRTVTVTLEKIVDRPVYLNQCLDSDGLLQLNAQIARAADPGQPSLKLPKP